MENENKPLLEEVLDYGQGYDDTVVILFQAFKKFRDGYYELINYGDNWWDMFNQGIDFDRIMKAEWSKIESINMMDCLEVMANNMAGTYVRFDKFVDGVTKCYEQGNGFRHDVKE